MKLMMIGGGRYEKQQRWSACWYSSRMKGVDVLMKLMMIGGGRYEKQQRSVRRAMLTSNDKWILTREQ
jgi:hypothetical protein